MQPENMPYYRGPRITMPPADRDDTTNAALCQAIYSSVMIDNCFRLCHVLHVSVEFGNFKQALPPTARALHNNEFPCYAQQVLQFSWAVYSFHGGHFASTIQSQNLPFCVQLACNPYESGRSLFQEFTSCRHIFSSATNLLNHIQASGDTSVINGYLIHSPRFQMSEMTTAFWQVQAAIISQLCLIRLLLMIIAMIHPDRNGRSIKTFSSNLRSNRWVISSTNVFYLDLGNTIAGSCHLIIAIHSSCAATVTLLLLKWPPLVPIRPLGEFIWEPFNRPEHAISLAHDDADFDKQDLQLKVSTHKSTTSKDSGIILKYSIHQPDSNNTVIVGSEVISVDGLCPAFNACPHSNIFQTYFGLKFHYNGHSYISTSEPSHPTNLFFASTSLTNSLTGFLNHHTNSASTLLCLLACPSGYLSKSMHIWCISKMPTVKCFCHTNSPCQQLQFKHLSMTQLEFSFLQMIDGSRHTSTILRCALSVTSSQTHPKSVTQH
jgi:hypothetical protein